MRSFSIEGATFHMYSMPRCYFRSRRPVVKLYNLQQTNSDLGLALPTRIHTSLLVQFYRSTYRSTYVRVLHFWLHHYLFNHLKSFETPEPKSHEQSLHCFKSLAFRGLDGWSWRIVHVDTSANSKYLQLETPLKSWIAWAGQELMPKKAPSQHLNLKILEVKLKILGFTWSFMAMWHLITS